MDAVGLVTELLHPVAGALADALREVSGAVIAVIAGDKAHLGRAAHAALTVLHHPRGGIDGGGPAGGEMHAVEIARRKAGQLGRKQGGRIIGHVDEGIGKGQPFGLRRNRLRHFRAAQTDIGAPEAADGIEILLAVGIPKPGTLPARNHQCPLILEGTEVGPGMQAVCAIHLPRRLGGKVQGGHPTLFDCFRQGSVAI